MRAASRASRAVVRQKVILGSLFVLPTVCVIVFFGVLPIVQSIKLSFFSWDVLTPMKYVGLANYRTALFEDQTARLALLHSVEMTVINVTFAVGLGFLAAEFLFHLRSRWVYAARTVFFLPYVISFAAVGVLFSFVLAASDFGLLNKILRILAGVGWIDRLTGLSGILPFNWLGDGRTSLPAISSVYIWKSFGFNMLLYYAAMQNIPATLLEAAAIDGASRWQRIRYIELPALKPVTQTLLVLAVVGNMLTFTIVNFLAPDGGPNRVAEVLATWFYKQSFGFLQFGYGAALAVLMAVVLGGLTVGLRKLVSVRDVEENL